MSDEATTRLRSRVFWAAVAAAAVPVAVAAIRAIERGWLPLGDNALMEIRGRDVFTGHHPLLGTASSASLSAGTELNHPGPLYFDAVALPVRIFGGAAGTAIAVAVVNTLSVIGIAVVARRRGGVLLGTVAAAMAATLCWTMGSEVLYEPWNPHSVVLPFMLFVMLAWSASCGDLVALPWAVGVGSLVLQTHLSYSLLVPILGAWAVIGLALSLRRARGAEPEKWPDLRRRVQRIGLITSGVAFVCWIQPVIEQLTSDGKGNLSRLFDAMTSSRGSTTGYGTGARLVASVVATPPFWFRPSFNEAFLPSRGWRAPSALGAALVFLALAAILAACARDARRRRDRVVSFALATSVVGIVAGVLTAGGAPVGVFGRATPHVLRWLWPLAAFTTFAIVAGVLRRITGAPERARVAQYSFAVIAVVFAILAIPTSNQSTGPNSQQWAIEPFDELRPQLDELEGKGPLLVDGLFEEVFDPYGGAIVAELQARDIDFVARSLVLQRQFGPDRHLEDSNARFAIYVRTGDSAVEGLPGTRQVVFVEGLSVQQEEELARLEEALGGSLEDRGIRLNADGRAARARGDLPLLREQRAEGAIDVAALIVSGEVLRMVEEDWIVIDDAWRDRYARWAELERERRRQTVAVFIGPVPSR